MFRIDRLRSVSANVAALVSAGIGGSFLYDYMSRKNLEKISTAFTNWDEEWDRYVRVSPELQQDIKDWFIAPDYEIVKKREEFDSDNQIGIRDIIMVRHGQYGSDGSLTSIGNDQADVTAKRLLDILSDKKVRCIFHSSLPRAKETAMIISQSFPQADIVETSLLNEAVPAPPDPPSHACAEYIPEEGDRIEKAFRTFFSRPLGDSSNCESVDILVGHGNCFRYFLCRALQIDPRFWLRMAIYNCGVSWVELDHDGRVSVRAVGDTGHMPREKLTYT